MHNAAGHALVTRESHVTSRVSHALVTAPLPNPSRPGPVLKNFMAGPSSNRPLLDARVRDDLDLTFEQREAR